MSSFWLSDIRNSYSPLLFGSSSFWNYISLFLLELICQCWNYYRSYLLRRARYLLYKTHLVDFIKLPKNFKTLSSERRGSSSNCRRLSCWLWFVLWFRVYMGVFLSLLCNTSAASATHLGQHNWNFAHWLFFSAPISHLVVLERVEHGHLPDDLRAGVHLLERNEQSILLILWWREGVNILPQCSIYILPCISIPFSLLSTRVIYLRLIVSSDLQKRRRSKECALLRTDADVPQGGVVRKTELGLESGQDFLFDLLHGVTAESVDLQRLADFSVTAHCKQHLQLLYTAKKHGQDLLTWHKQHLFMSVLDFFGGEHSAPRCTDCRPECTCEWWLEAHTAVAHAQQFVINHLSNH